MTSSTTAKDGLNWVSLPLMIFLVLANSMKTLGNVSPLTLSVAEGFFNINAGAVGNSIKIVKFEDNFSPLGATRSTAPAIAIIVIFR